MSQIDWRKELGWSDEQLDDLRFAGYSYIRQGKYDIALPFYEALNVISPESVYDAQTLGALYLQLNRPADAVKFLDKALKLEPNHAPTVLNITKAFFMLGKKSEALKLAKVLTKERDPYIANIAKALLLAYS